MAVHQPQQSVCVSSAQTRFAVASATPFETKQPADPLLALFFGRLPPELRREVYSLALAADDADPARRRRHLSLGFWTQCAWVHATGDTAATSSGSDTDTDSDDNSAGAGGSGSDSDDEAAPHPWMLQSRQLFIEASDVLWRMVIAKAPRRRRGGDVAWRGRRLHASLATGYGGGFGGEPRPLFAGLAARHRLTCGRDFAPYSLAMTCRAVRQVHLTLRLSHDVLMYGEDLCRTPAQFAAWAARAFGSPSPAQCQQSQILDKQHDREKQELPRFPSLRRLALAVSVGSVPYGNTKVEPLRRAVIEGRGLDWLRADPSWRANLQCLAGKLHRLVKDSVGDGDRNGQVDVEFVAGKYGEPISVGAQQAIAAALRLAYTEIDAETGCGSDKGDAEAEENNSRPKGPASDDRQVAPQWSNYMFNM